MASVDGKEGIRLKDFIAMWTEDGTKLVKQDERKLNGTIWLLYSVYFPDSTYDYGRHMALLLKVDAETERILLHDLTNIIGEVRENWSQYIDGWFEEHVGQY